MKRLDEILDTHGKTQDLVAKLDDGLYLCGIEGVKQTDLQELEIKRIVNCAPSVCRDSEYKSAVEPFEVLKLDADDYPGYPLLEKHLEEFSNYLNEAKENNEV